MHTRPPCPTASQSPDPSDLRLFIITWLFSMIANIANRALVSTYISQVKGNHLTSIGLSIAKHIFDPRPT